MGKDIKKCKRIPIFNVSYFYHVARFHFSRIIALMVDVILFLSLSLSLSLVLVRHHVMLRCSDKSLMQLRWWNRRACDCSLNGDAGDAMSRRRFLIMRRRDDLVALPTTSRTHQAKLRQVPGVQTAAPEADGG